jgi:hypothetical protein
MPPETGTTMPEISGAQHARITGQPIPSPLPATQHAA